jgi:hypothetical protein
MTTHDITLWEIAGAFAIGRWIADFVTTIIKGYCNEYKHRKGNE